LIERFINKIKKKEYCITIIINLFENSNENQIDKIINKFKENDFEKTDRLLEIYFKYNENVVKFDQSVLNGEFKNIVGFF
jgi:beta-catenin-like protein 1